MSEAANTHPAQSVPSLQRILNEHDCIVVEGLVDGGGEQAGVGPQVGRELSMTAVSECMWGMSGRGNPKAKLVVACVARRGYVKIRQKGRAQMVSLTEKGLELYHATRAERGAAWDACPNG